MRLYQAPYFLFDIESNWHYHTFDGNRMNVFERNSRLCQLLLKFLAFIARLLIQDNILISYTDRSDKEMEKLISWLKDEIDVCIGYDLPRQHLENIINALDDVSTVKTT